MTRRLLSDDQHGALGILVGLTMIVAPKLSGLGRNGLPAVPVRASNSDYQYTLWHGRISNQHL